MRHACTGMILAGGRGSRMGGADKGLVELQGRPLVAHAIDALRPQVSRLLISANRNHDRYAAFGLPVLADSLPDFQGPLSGLLAGLSRCETPWLVSVPCDMPQIPVDLASELLRMAKATRRRAAFAVLNDEPSYVCALVHRSLLPCLDATLAQGERSVWRWLAQHDACAVAFELAPGVMINLNSPDQFVGAA
jgi:molybdenum cofactor guanylyltransferase